MIGEAERTAGLQNFARADESRVHKTRKRLQTSLLLEAGRSTKPTYRTTTSRLPGSRFHNKTRLSNDTAYICGRGRNSVGTVSVAFASSYKALHLTSTCRHRTDLVKMGDSTDDNVAISGSWGVLASYRDASTNNSSQNCHVENDSNGSFPKQSFENNMQLSQAKQANASPACV